MTHLHPSGHDDRHPGTAPHQEQIVRTAIRGWADLAAEAIEDLRAEFPAVCST